MDTDSYDRTKYKLCIYTNKAGCVGTQCTVYLHIVVWRYFYDLAMCLLVEWLG